MREATVHLSSDQLEAFGIGDFVASIREAGLERVTELQCERPGCLLVIDVADAIPPERLSTIPTLEWWEGVSGSDGTTYLCKLAVPALQEGVDPHHESATVDQTLAATGEGIDITLVGDQDALSDRVEEFGATGATPVLRTLADYDGPRDPLDALTARQREVLTTAFEMGYFEVPRAATTDDLATALGIDPSTVREHLQRAQRNLLASLLDEP